jgi:hypothetical protein
MRPLDAKTKEIGVHPPRWFLTILAWDGILPLIVVSVPLLVRWTCPPGHIAEVGAVVLLPMFAALIRSQFAWEQFGMSCATGVTWDRQVLFAAAIILLLFFEITCGAAAMAREALQEIAVLAAIPYLLYLAPITIALRPDNLHSDQCSE